MGRCFKQLGMAMSLFLLLGAPMSAQPKHTIITAYGTKKSQFSKTPQPTTGQSEFSQASATRFGRAFRSFFGANALQTATQMVVEGSSGGANFTISMQHQTIVKSTGQFKINLAFQTAARSGRQYQLICDGTKLWIYRPDVKQFSVQTYKQFDASDDSFLMGLSTGLYLSTPEFRQLMTTDSPTPQELQDAGIQDRGQKTAANGKQYAVYGMIDPQKQTNETNIELWINPNTDQIEILRISGQEKNMNITLQETIQNYQKNPVAQSSLFTFRPPAETRQVPKLSIDPF